MRRRRTCVNTIALSILWLGVLLAPLGVPTPALAQRNFFFSSSWNSGPWGVGNFTAASIQVGAWGGFGWGGPLMPLAPLWTPPPPIIVPPPIFAPPVVVGPIFPPVLWAVQPFGWGGGWNNQPLDWGGWAGQPVGFNAWPNQAGLIGGVAGVPLAAVNPLGPLPAIDPLPPGPLENLQGAPLPPLRAANAEARARAERFIEIGDRYFDQQNFRSAYVRYDQATDAAPDMVEAQLRKGQSLIALGNYEMAAQAFKVALRVKDWTDSPLRWKQIYGANLAAKDMHLQALATAAHNNPNDPDLMLLVGMELFFDDQIPRSVKFFQRYAGLRDGAPGGAIPAGGNVEAFVGVLGPNDDARAARNPAPAAAILPADGRPKPQPPPAIGEGRPF